MIKNELIKVFENFNMESDEAQEYIETLFKNYKEKNSHKDYSEHNYVTHNIIGLYYYYITKTDFEYIIPDFKQLYIYNESMIEDNSTIEEQLGISEIYDYIKDYNIDKEFNIFIEAMKIHELLYSKCIGKSFGGVKRY